MNMDNPGLSQQLKLVSASANYWLIFCVPLIISVCITQLVLHQVYPFDKYLLEDVALIITAGFCLICFSRFVYSKAKFFLWASGMMLVLFIREVHPPGSSGGVYLGLLALFYIAYKNHHFFADYFRDKRLVNLLGTGFFSYFIAVTTDQRFWKFIPAEKIFHTSLEESLEVLGHILIGCALLFATRKYGER
jgi:hypothetical protein